MIRSLCVALAALVLSGLACEGGTEVGNPIVSIGFSAYHQPSGVGARAAAAGRVEVTAAWIAFRELKLRPAAACESSAEIEIAGPIAVDLFGAIPPPLRDLETAATGYCRLEIKWHKAESLVGAPPELAGVAVYVAGTRADGKRFVIRSERNDALELRARGGSFQITPTLAGLFVGFDLSVWLAGVDLAAATPGSDEVVHVEKGQNDAQLAAFEANVAAASKLFIDSDGNRALDASETDDADAVGDGVSR